ncbi:MAG TPA: PKD domain-containing protein [Bacteroidales bacterium]|nr:PKD domain-containing protein [Bacteroidales bacterium]
MRKYIYMLVILPVILASCESNPEASFFTDKVEAFVGEDIYFTNDSYNAVDYEWDFGDGTYSDAVDAVHSYNVSGTFEVALTVWNRNGRSDEAYQTISVISPTILEIEVLEWNEEYPVPNANVRLYPTLEDWDAETNMQSEGFTGMNGKVVFFHLGSYVYYVDVWETNHNNFDLRGYDNDYYIRIPQLVPNEVNTFIAYVDYVEGKGVDQRNRSMVIRKIERKPKDVVLSGVRDKL